MSVLAKLIVGLGLDASEYDRGLGDAEKKADGFGSKIGGFLGSAMKMGLAATAGGVVAALGAIVSGVASNAEFERYETQFGVLLGSTEAAKQRLEELAEFGAKTPFELPEVVRADKILQGFGLHSLEAAERFGFSGEQIRTIAGDVASGTGASFEEMSLLIGKMSTGATGEAISRMAELGIASKEELAKLGLEFDKSGALLSPLPEAMEVVLQLMEDKYGGMMLAQSSTFEGMMSNLQDWASGTLRTISQPIFEVAKEKLQGLLTFLNDPATQAGLQAFATGLADGVGMAMDFIANTAIPSFQTAWANLQPVLSFVIGLITQIVNTASNIIAAFSDAGVSSSEFKEALSSMFGAEIADAISNFATWLSVRIPEAISAARDFATNVLLPALLGVWQFIQTNVLPILGTLVVWLLNNIPVAIDATVNFIQTSLIPALSAVWSFIQANVLPIFNTVVAWLQVNIPVAIQTLSDFWNNTLLPAIRNTYDFIQNNVIPQLSTFVSNTIASVNRGLQTLADFWNNILKPAITAVYNFLNTYVIPLFQAIVNVHIAVFKLALRALAAVWTEVVQPAIEKVTKFVQTYVIPIWEKFESWLKNVKQQATRVAFFFLGNVQPILQALNGIIEQKVIPAWEAFDSVMGGIADAASAIGDAIGGVIDWLNDLAASLNSISIPDWLQGHSPPPMAHWFGYIADAAALANDEYDSFNRKLANGHVNMPDVPISVNGSASSALQQNISLPITANYAYQDEKTVRDEIRMQAMMLGLNPTG